MDEKEYLTEEKKKTLEKELEYLTKTKRKEVAEQLEYAKSLGDLSENAEYHEARETQGIVEDRIKKIESILKNASIVSADHKSGAVAIGSEIVVKKEGDGAEKVYTIVGGEESDITSGKISIHSPLGEAALGKKKGEKFTFSAPAGPITYKIIDIK